MDGVALFLQIFHLRHVVLILVLQTEHVARVLVQLSTALGEVNMFGFGGRIIARVVDIEAELLMIVTETSKQNTGLATNCLLNIEKKLSQKGAQKLTLEVSESNSAAITIYTKLNYKKIAIRKSYSRDKNGKFETALVMQKDLRPN